MNRALAFRSVARSLTRFKARAALGGIGILVSVLATIVVLSLGGSVRTTFDVFVARFYPADVVTVNGGSVWGGGAGSQNMKVRDIEAVVSAVPEIVAWDVLAPAGGRDVRAGAGGTRVAVMGSSDKTPQVRRRRAEEGEFIDAVDVEARARVAVVGQTTARVLFGSDSPIGQTIFIDNMPFEVKGILERTGVNPHGSDEDDVVFIPYTVAMDSLLKIDYVRQVAYQVADPVQTDEAGRQIAAVMREQHGITEGRTDDFSVILPRDMQARVASTFRTINLFVALICVAAFVISALVVLALMHVSVRQRVPELGLRKAVGADASAIRSQILWEAIVIAAVGCLLGALIAGFAVYFTAPLLARQFGVEGAQLSVIAVLTGAGGAAVTALLGAWLPARRAAKLDPVEALRMT